jgi:hypothetical protein
VTIDFSDILANAQEYADMVPGEGDSDGFVPTDTWRVWINHGIRELHDVVTTCFKATYFRTTLFTLAGTTYQYTLPSNLKRVKGVDIDPGTPRRRTVRPFNFGDRNSYLGGTMSSIATYCRYRRYSVLGSGLLQIEPQEQASGNYALYWVPKATELPEPDFTVRALVTSLPNYDDSGLPTLVALANGALPAQDGVALLVNDRVLFTGGVAGKDNGIFKVVAVGDGSHPWSLTRTTDYDQNAEIAIGDVVQVTEGTKYAGTEWLNSSAAIDVDAQPMTFSPSVVDTEIEPYIEYPALYAARNALTKEESFDQANMMSAQMNQIRADMSESLENDEGGPSTIVDVHRGGTGGFW